MSTTPGPLMLDADQIELRDLVRTMLADRCPIGRVQQMVDESTPPFDADLWQRLVAELGVAALRLPESDGGMGTGFREPGVVTEELARALAPVPYLSSAVLAAAVLAATTPAGAELAAQIGAGRIAAVAVSDDPALGWPVAEPHGTVATSVADAWRLTGTKHHVIGVAEAATVLVWAALPDGTAAVFAVEADRAGIEVAASLDLTRSVGRVVLAETPGVLVARGEPAQDALVSGGQELRAALALEQAGICQTVLDLTVEYVRTRVQFAQPIGSFQAVKHTLADLAVLTDQIRTAADHAARSIGTAAAAEATALATAVVHERAEEVVFECLQLLGGIGFTWEHPMHLYVRRVVANARLLGSTSSHREDYLRAAGY